MTIRLKQAEVLPTGQSSNVTLDANLFSDLYQARREFADSLGNLAKVPLQFQKIRDESDYAEARASFITQSEGFFESELNNPQWQDSSKRTEDFLINQRKELLDSGRYSHRVKNELKGWLTLNGANLKKQVAITTRRKFVDVEKAKTFEAISSLERAGNAYEARASIEAAVASGIFSAEEGAIRIENVGKNIETATAVKMIQLAPQLAVEVLAADYDGPDQFTMLDDVQKADLYNRARTELNSRQQAFERQQAALMEQTDNNFLLAYRKNELKPEDIDVALANGTIKRDRAEHYFDLLSKASTDKSDPIVRADLNDEVLSVKTGIANRNTVRNKIDAARRDGKLTDEHYFSLRDDLEKSYVSFVQEAVNEAKRFGKSQILSQGLMGFEGQPPQFARLNEYNKALDDWIIEQQKTQKPVSAADVYVKSRELVPFYRMSPGKLAEAMAADMESLQRQEGNSPAPAGLENIWGGLSDQEKVEARELLRRGVSPEKIREAVKQ